MFGCKGCEALRSENEYLKGLVDRLLAKLEVHHNPEIRTDKTEPIDDEEVERIIYGNP
jgi:hypothetical protein